MTPQSGVGGESPTPTSRTWGRAEDGRHRDVFPLPEPCSDNLNKAQLKGLSRSTARRLHRRRHRGELQSEMVVALNELSGNSDGSSRSTTNACQREALQHIAKCAARFGEPPADMHGQGALQELLSKTTYVGEPSSVVPLDVSALALPESGFAPVDLCSVGEEYGKEVSRRLCEKVLPEHLLTVEAKQTIRPYVDPVLRQRPKVYGRLISRMLDCGLVELGTDCRQTVGLFAVKKSNGDQRLIVDCRPANAMFEASDPVSLATGQSFAQLKVDSGEPIAVAGVDIKVAFYALQLPVSLRSFCGLPKIQAG